MSRRKSKSDSDNVKVNWISAFPIFSLLFCWVDPALPKSSIDLEATSTDGAVLSGQIDLPQSAPDAVAVLIPGTGVHTRAGVFGPPNSKGEHLFEAIARRLSLGGIAVIRFDERGYSCGSASLDSKGGCKNDAVVATINPENKAKDLGLIVSAALNKIPSVGKCFVAIPHSEGFLSLSRAIQAGYVLPYSIVAISPPLQSPVDLMKWQYTERWRVVIEEFDTDRDGLISDEELQRSWRTSSYGFAPLPLIFRDGNTPTVEAAAWGTRLGHAAYRHARLIALAKGDTEPNVVNGSVEGSYAWQRQWFLDDLPVIKRTDGYSGSIIMFYGVKDRQFALDKQLQLANQESLKREISVRQFEQLGHSLGINSISGPMDEVALDKIVIAVVERVNMCRGERDFPPPPKNSKSGT